MPSAALAVQLHESAISNLATSMLAERTVSEQQIRAFLERLWGAGSEESPVDEQDMLYINFAGERPITIGVDNQIVTIHLRANYFFVNRRKYAPMNVTVRYRLQRSERGVLATQEEDPEISPPRFETDGPGRLGTREITARKLIANMLQRELAKTYRLDQFMLPKPADVYGAMVVTQLVADDSWVTVGVERMAAVRSLAMIEGRRSTRVGVPERDARHVEYGLRPRGHRRQERAAQARMRAPISVDAGALPPVIE